MRRDARAGSDRMCFKAVIRMYGEYRDDIKHAARFGTASISSVISDCDGCQMDDAYSSFGRTYARCQLLDGSGCGFKIAT